MLRPVAYTLATPQLDRTVRPDFAIRDAGTRYKDGWKTKVGFSARELGYPSVGDENLAYLVPPDEYFETHPEFYAMDKGGDRHRGRHPRYTMPCLSNVKMFEEAVKNLRQALGGEKKVGGVRERGFGRGEAQRNLPVKTNGTDGLLVVPQPLWTAAA